MLRRAQVDNLRTNHRGTFVLKDNTFRWLAKLSVDPPPPPGAGAPAAVTGVSELARDYLVLPCALVRAPARRRPALGADSAPPVLPRRACEHDMLPGLRDGACTMQMLW